VRGIKGTYKVNEKLDNKIVKNSGNPESITSVMNRLSLIYP
jgi:hypothetical protein